MVNLVFLVSGIEIASRVLVLRKRYLTFKRWISQGEGDANCNRAEHRLIAQSSSNKKAGGTRFFIAAIERALHWVCALQEISEALQEWRNHQANNRHHVDQNVH